MKRSVGGFEVSWALGRGMVTDRGRTEFYDFTVSADLKQIVGRYSSTRPDIQPGDVFAQKAREAADEFLRQEQADKGAPRSL
jgi:hypothetical protein